MPPIVRLAQHLFWPGRVFVLLALVCAAGSAGAEDKPAAEMELKVAYFFNFLSLIDTSPLRPDDTKFQICIAGDSSLQKSFQTLRSEKIREQPIELIVISRPEVADVCDALFIAHDSNIVDRDYLDYLRGKGVLTVGESNDFCRRGGIINFFFEDNKLRFEVNLTRAKEEQIRFPAKVLKHGKALE